MADVARKAGFAEADKLAFGRSARLEDVWSITCEICGVAPDDLARVVASSFGVAVADMDSAEPTATRLIPASIARKFGVFPVRAGDRFIVVATSNPTDPEVEQQVGFASGRSPALVVAPPTEIEKAIEGTYSAEIAAESLLSQVGGKFEDMDDIEVDVAGEDAPEEISEADAATGPVVRLTNIILHEAVARGASDIHIQPMATGGLVRFRTDGVLHAGMQMPLPVLTRVISRIKIMSRLDIADRLRPQDGRARILVSGRKYDLRVSTVPTRQSEKAVIRVLDTQRTGTLEDTGIAPKEIDRIRHALSNRDGIFVVTGPTGSGKTTTLYGALREISTADVNIMTVEDPVEYELAGLTQIQVEPKQGVTFSSALRAILRQDPDVIFVGEIRDGETAEIATQASLTGHLVLASLHTNDAVGSIRRMIDLGLDPGTVGETLRGALAQRLVRRVCSCAEPATEPFTPTESALQERFGCLPTVRKKGCSRCLMQGYFGRLPVTEFLTPSSDLVRLILDGAPLFELQQQAVRDGMRTLLDSALDRVRAGETTLEEVERVVGSSDRDAGRPAEQPENVAAARGDLGVARPRTGGAAATPAPVVTASAEPRDRAPQTDDAGVEDEAAHILVVDDDESTRTLARGVLEELGYRVSEADDGSEALARLARGEHFALMVLDLEMPMLGGRQVLQAVRGSIATAGLPVVVLTGTADANADIELMEQGADDYIRKPIDPPRFGARIKAALRRAGS